MQALGLQRIGQETTPSANPTQEAQLNHNRDTNGRPNRDDSEATQAMDFIGIVPLRTFHAKLVPKGIQAFG